jgi:GPH family glycoside/pentoside/hexuronide:cation symporter
MTPDYNERTRLMAMSQIMGQIAWMIAPWFWFLISRPELFPTAPHGVRTLSIYVGLLCLVMGIMPALFCKEIDQANLHGQTKLSLRGLANNLKSFFRDIMKTVTNKPFLRLCGATFFVFNGFQIVAQFAFFIIIFYMYKGDQQAAGQWPAWFGTVSAIATAFLVIPVITYMSTRIGKRNAFIVSTFISIVGYALKWYGFHPGNPWLIFMPIPLMSFGIGGLFTLMMSMTADVCDYDELKNGMPRKEGLFGAVYWWMVKLGTSLALFLSGVILSSVGFNQNAQVQAASTITSLRLADILVPSIAGILAVTIMWGYNISEARAKEIREELVSRRGEL